MKTTIGNVAMWVTGIILLTAGAGLGDLNDGLIAYYKFDATSGPVIDETGNYNGINYGATRGVTGKVGNAFQFDGYNDYIDTLPRDAIPTVSTISLWMKPLDNAGSATQVFGSIDYPHVGQHGFGIGYYELDSYEPDGSVHSYRESVNAVNYHDLGTVRSARDSFPLGEWTHLTYTCDPTNNVNIYANGSLSGSGVFDTSPSVHARALMFGKLMHSQNRAFNGLIDEVRIYNRVLEQSEIQLLAGATIQVPVDIKPGSCPNPLNVKDKGLLSVAVLGSEDFDVLTIDVASIRLEGVAPVRSSYEDVAAPVADGAQPCECTTAGPDGQLDLTLKFNTQDIVATLGPVNNADELELILTGMLDEVFGGTPIEGTDCIIVQGAK